jgi:hypothetical protein
VRGLGQGCLGLGLDCRCDLVEASAEVRLANDVDLREETLEDTWPPLWHLYTPFRAFSFSWFFLAFLML